MIDTNSENEHKDLCIQKNFLEKCISLPKGIFYISKDKKKFLVFSIPFFVNYNYFYRMF